ncbi:protein serine/threonine phosphatase 2C [Auriscalpium vulgare]|uniref:Protein serine/threonine phosphatase 2C n=1 Tax=Auriscalpium vulgare TaxID=40419 RepID=A0ACB8RXG3_9AGAM|nr:protein serine/threonine phosphatase 2C [Auriscalpium vulgare]
MGWSEYTGGALWTYRKLPEPLLSRELNRLSAATTISGAHCVSLQPCPNPEAASQDRYAVEDWHIGSGNWRFAAIFDGHAGHEMVDHTVQNLPSRVKEALAASVGSGDSDIDVRVVSDCIKRAITAFDESVVADLLAIFPGGEEEFSKLSDGQISEVINSAEHSVKVLRCMRGTTALVTLVDPSNNNLWVASLGDCQAALGTRETSGGWKVELLSTNHNGEDPAEAERIRSEHPGEAECIMRDRVLGAIAITRALGDHLYKLPRIYTDRIFLNMKQRFKFSVASVDEILPRNITPPYLSNVADIQHVRLAAKDSRDKPEQILILCSDGLIDLYSARMSLQLSAQRWVKAATEGTSGEGNAAARLLRDALGGGDVTAVSKMLTVEMTSRWMDDTTIIVQYF